MTITVSGRALLLLTTGLWICLAGPSPYAASAATDAPGAHHGRKSAHHASSDDSSKTAEAKKPDDNDDGSAPASSAELPPTVANANAQAAAAAAANLNPVAGDRTLNSPQAVLGAPPAAGTFGTSDQPGDATGAPASPPPVTVAAAVDAPSAASASPAAKTAAPKATTGAAP